MGISHASLGGCHGGSHGLMKQLRLAGCFMAIPLASLGGYHDGSQSFMKELGLTGSSMSISLALKFMLMFIENTTHHKSQGGPSALAHFPLSCAATPHGHRWPKAKNDVFYSAVVMI